MEPRGCHGPVNPATPSAQNPSQQPASCRPAVGMKKASNQKSLQLRSSLHLKRGPSPDPQESTALNGRVLGFFRQINSDGAVDVLSCFHLRHSSRAWEWHCFCKAGSGQTSPRKSETEFPRGAGVQELESMLPQSWPTVTQW